MIDIIEQQKFDLLNEEKTIVLTNNQNRSYLTELNHILNGLLDEVMVDDIITIRPSVTLKTKKIIVIKSDVLNCREKRKEIFRKLSDTKEDSVFLLDSFENDNTEETIYDLTESLLDRSEELTLFLSKKKEVTRTISFFGDLNVEEVIRKAFYTTKSIITAKNLVNAPYNYMNAEKLALHAKDLEKYNSISVKIIEKKEIESMNMGLFLGVNKGSYDDPKLIYIKYQGLDKFENPTALVGKGVMYDTGGYSLKTPISMPGMKGDMAGAAAVIGAVEAIAKLKLKVNLIGIIAATDNRMGEYAIVPDDILTSAKGLTVEIISTDAEGRLTLADAIWFAQREGASKIIDIATLTGAMAAALGSDFTGAFTNDKHFLSSFKVATENVDEPIWEMPVSRAHHKDIKSELADIKNKGGKSAGASTAAAFLEEFVEKDTSWIHLDIAGTSSSSNGLATGVMVKSFVEYFYLNQ